MEKLTLFSQDSEPKTQKIRIRSIRAVFNNVVIRENAPNWVNTACTSAENVFELFRDLAKEAKENFVALHLDAKNRIICFDTVSIGSLNASIVHPREVYKTALLSSAAAVLFYITTHQGIRHQVGKILKSPSGSRMPENSSESVCWTI